MTSKFSGDLAVTGSDEADQLLNKNPLALLLGMLLDQQIPMEWAFKSPYTLLGRLGELNASQIASMDPTKFESICKEKPAIHRFPSSMAGRIQDLCEHLVENYNGEAEQLWASADSGETLYNRLIDLPGFGSEK
ncbi:Fe-S cluster assembly protein HesB, partial [bacterium]|nr:Fe-S cluster assembly protein HesB [bacterium]